MQGGGAGGGGGIDGLTNKEERRHAKALWIYSVWFVNKELLGIVRFVLWDINYSIGSNINFS